MKKILLLLLLFSVAVSSYAGDNKNKKGDYPKVRFGAEGGLNLANFIDFTGSSQTNFTLTWHAGVYADISFNENFTFQPELLYDVNGAYFPGLFTSHVNCLDLPMLFKGNVGKGFAIYGGPYLGYLINSSWVGITTTYSNSQNDDSEINTFDIGTVIGFEHQWGNGLNMGLKYTQGLCYLSSTVSGSGYDMVFSLYAGWTFK